MPLIPYRPFWDLERWFEREWDDLDRFFNAPVSKIFARMDFPKVDLYEKEGKIVAEVAVPGIKPEEINIEIEDNVLKIEGKKEEKKEEEKKGYYRKEISTGFFRRIVPLPTEVKKDNVQASLEDGILKIVMEKATKEKTKGIKIKVSKEKK
jgi:HSP20 family protein